MLVVARYKEDLGWLNNINIPKTVYNKGPDHIPDSIKLENRGREAETYLRYIIDNYDTMPQRVFFTQGNPFDHCPRFLDDITHEFQSPDTWNVISLTGFHEWVHGFHTHRGIEDSFKFTFKELFNKDPPVNIHYPVGAIFGVTKRAIHYYSIDFWKNLRNKILESEKTPNCSHPHVHNNPACGCRNSYSPWCFERVWLYLFEIKS